MKYYVVKKGRQTGIFLTWPECQEQIKGYSGAVFKSFTDLDTAQAYFNKAKEEKSREKIDLNLPVAYSDGSYSKKNNCYSYGVYLSPNYGRAPYLLQGRGNNPEFLPEKNIAGELIGAMQVAFTCQNLNIKEINLYFDYAGVEAYLTGAWEVKTPLALYYRQTMEIMQDVVKIHFIKIKGHSGNWGNDIADTLAKEAAGVTIQKKELQKLNEFRQRQKEHIEDPTHNIYYRYLQPENGFSNSYTCSVYEFYTSPRTEAHTKQLIQEVKQIDSDDPAEDLALKIEGLEWGQAILNGENYLNRCKHQLEHTHYREAAKRILEYYSFTGKGA